MGLLDDIKSAADQHEDQVEQAIDKAGDAVDQATDSKFAGKVDRAQEFLKDKIGQPNAQ
ncbi:antitoxin [Propionimicrobium sp. PCR01-08-3]|uniref:antitoxin n=1 Tax=Propionimicrobium sp. PCR01-08-3 TaxID=3052086 RepID=UPI00255C462B|nr:antitoxin [Propionimicrobium sp. PCR01-08-3]WIY83662.1 antitoxin [Propionimicrobium sp. PCR01-08-3]